LALAPLPGGEECDCGLRTMGVGLTHPASAEKKFGCRTYPPNSSAARQGDSGSRTMGVGLTSSRSRISTSAEKKFGALRPIPPSPPASQRFIGRGRKKGDNRVGCEIDGPCSRLCPEGLARKCRPTDLAAAQGLGDADGHPAVELSGFGFMPQTTAKSASRSKADKQIHSC
jgi:hypothetical protein